MISRLDESAWLDALLDPRTRLRVQMLGLPFRMASPAGWDTRPRRIAEHLVYFVARGRCLGEAGGKSFTLGTGELCWVCPGVTFRFRAMAGTAPLVIQRFRLSVQSGRRELRLQWDYRVFSQAAPAIEWARLLVLEADRRGAMAAVRLRCLAALFGTEVFGSRQGRPREGGLARAAAQAISRHVLEHSGERLRPRDLARVAALSPDYFARQFRASFGMAPKAWLVRERLRHAAELLAETDLRVSEIADRLGYRDVALFSRQFRREFGCSPRAWRQGDAE